MPRPLPLRRPLPVPRALALLLPLLAASCAAGPATRHFIIEGTDGVFGIKVIGEGPEDVCRAEALRIAQAELRRRRPTAPPIHEHGMTLMEQAQGGGRACLAEITISTLPPWN